MPQTPPDDGLEAAPDGREITATGSHGIELSADEAEVIEQIAELLPPERRGQLLQVIQSHRGWLPPPAMLAEYEQVLPGLAERIVALPEREQAHRHRYLDRETKRQFTLRRRGQDYALVGMALILAFAVLLAWIGEAAWAARLVIVTLIGVVGIFVTGKWLDVKADRDEGESGDE